MTGVQETRSPVCHACQIALTTMAAETASAAITDNLHSLKHHLWINMINIANGKSFSPEFLYHLSEVVSTLKN